MGAKGRGAWLAVAMWALAGCGGGGGGGEGSLGNPSSPGGNNPGGNNGVTYTQGVFPLSSSLANQCASPRPGTTDRSGSAFTEGMFLRSWTNELYLWYSEVPDISPASYTTADYFDQLKTPLTTASGRDKDQFHFTYPTDVWEDLSQGGIEVGYGVQWMFVARANANPQVMAAFVEPGFAAEQQGLVRGIEVLVADGLTVANISTQAQVDQLYEALFPVATGETHTFTIRETSGVTRSISMRSAAVTHQPVLMTSVVEPGVGYMVFNDHIATAETQLIDAVADLRAAGVQDLILDLRYNGGGLLDIASELAYMIAGPTMTSGQPFERLVFNDKHTSTNPVTGQPLAPTPFHSTAVGFPVTSGQRTSPGTPLPTLNLNRVYVITGNNTCSASESIINSLRGVDVDVYQIGSTTCGKPYGFYPQSNCGTTYFSIQFEGRNAANFGNYPDGFTPQNSVDAASVELPGCSVADDFTRELGDPLERRLQAALAFRSSANTVCPSASSFTSGPGVSSKQAPVPADGEMFKSPLRENRILRNERRGLAF